MKSVKKMLSLLLVAMLLVTAIPFAASAAATEVEYAVAFAVEKGSQSRASGSIAHFTVSSSATNEGIRAGAEGALSAAGYSSVTANDIVNAINDPNFVHDVDFGNIHTWVDPTNHIFYFILTVTDRPTVTTTDYDVDAEIWVYDEGTANFKKTTSTVKVTLVQTKVGGGNTTYALKSNGGASIEDIRKALGADYNNKQLSVTIQGPSTDGRVSYRVTVLGSNGSTGTNIPSYDATGGNNNGITIEGGNNNNSNNNNNNNNGTIGSGGSAGNGSTGSNGGTNGTTGTTNPPSYSEVPGNVYLEIYTNKNFGSYDARFSITNNSNKNYNIGTDGTVSAERGGDLWNLMASIYTAKDSNGMEVKLYQFEGNNFPVDWAFGNYYTSISNLTAARQNKDITIRVVVNNVYRKTADTSNPKTGDPIMMSVAVLGITACGLAAAYIYSKKRKAV